MMVILVASFHLRPPRSILRTFVIRFHSLELTTVPLLAIFYFYYSVTYSSASLFFFDASLGCWVIVSSKTTGGTHKYIQNASEYVK